MRTRIRLAGTLAGITAACVVAGLVGLSFAFVHPAATPISPAAGVGVAALLLVGLRAWPAVAVAAFITNIIALNAIGASVAIAAGNTLECLLAAALTMRVAHGRFAFDRGADVFRFMFSAIGASIVGAAIGVTAIRIGIPAIPADTWRTWITWWLGDATGIAIITPFAVLFAARLPAPLAGRREIAALVLALVLVLYAAFGVPAEVQRDFPVAVLLLPLMLWSAFRMDTRTTAAMGVVMSVVGVYRTLQHYGPFELGTPAHSLLIVQSIVAIISLLMLAVAAETVVRRRVESALRLLNETLERHVQDRTAELSREHERFVDAQAVAQIGSWEWDVTSNTLWWSDEMCRIFGVTAAPVGYEPYLTLIHPDDRKLTEQEVEHAIATGRPFTFEHRIVRPDGEHRLIHARGRVEFDAAGAPRRMLGTGHDITERHRAEEARLQLIHEQAKLREAEEMNRAKDAFLATLSHELRTPLNAALGWMHILRESTHASGRDERIVQTIYRNLLLQSRIVSDIMDISRIAKGEFPLEREPVEVRAVFESAADMVRESATARDVTITLRSIGSAQVVGDSRRLQQVAWNLLSNCVKFCTNGGEVLVSIREDADSVECMVEDDGPGIAPAFLPHIFEQFRQADSSTTREHGGLGLGLAIAHDIVAMHDGTIVAGNRPAGGAVFVVRLPKHPAPVASAKARPGVANTRMFS